MPTKLNKALVQRIRQHLRDFAALDPIDQQRDDPYARAYGGEVVYLALKLNVPPLRAKTLIRMAGDGAPR